MNPKNKDKDLISRKRVCEIIDEGKITLREVIAGMPPELSNHNLKIQMYNFIPRFFEELLLKINSEEKTV